MHNLKFSIEEKLFFLLGLFSTIQLLSIAGITVFNLVLIAVGAVGVVFFFQKKIKFNKYSIIFFTATIITTVLAINNNDLSDDFRIGAITGGVLRVLVLCVYILLNEKLALAYTRGFKISCILALIWSYLQEIVYMLTNLDLNNVIFGGLLGINGANSLGAGGEFVPTGFFTHRAILLPILLFLFFSTSNIYFMLIIVLLAVLTRATALILGLMVAIVLRAVVYMFENKTNKIQRKQFISVLPAIFIVILFVVFFHKNIAEIINYVIVRISDVTTNKADNSSVVHFLYYKNLPAIISNMDFIHILFGTGMGTSGQHYTWFNGQYANLGAWVVESDYIDILLSQGIIGFMVNAYLLIRIIVFSKKYKYWENIAFIIVIAFVGIMYNLQFNWFIVFEMAMLILTKNGIRVFRKNDIKEVRS